MARCKDEGHAALMDLSGKIERRHAGKHQVDDRNIEGWRLAGGVVQFVKAARDGDIFSAAVPAQLLDIHGDEEFIFQDENAQTIERFGQGMLQKSEGVS
ncbi:hypothetical protein GCM10007937_22910 [Mesorhizobium albiziae]|nr:hypothetical protein GCM10007937_22910 [Mesorhizobium albiziae]